jgi:hypothetical protein
LLPRLMGMETEYALAGYGPARGSAYHDALLSLLMETARSRLTHLDGMRDAGIFLANGSRFYIDAGGHPEMCTPECTHPGDVVRYCLANERILAGLLDAMGPSLPPGSNVALYKCNVDYGDTRATWGCHESYLHRADPEVLHGPLLPHLVSRIVYTGAGGFDTTTDGLTFLLSPRVAHIVRVSSDQSTGDRGIIHTKDESLTGRRYHRLHLICGESLCSRSSLWLRFGVTALVVAMIEGGLPVGRDLELVDPLAALRTFAGDPACRATTMTRDGRLLRAVDIQRLYLAAAESNLSAGFMPEWAGTVCAEWRSILDRLEGAPASVATILDWAVKYALFGARLRRHDLDWDSALCWTEVIEEIHRCARTGGTPEHNLSLERLIGPRGPMRITAASLAPFLREHGQEWVRLPQFRAARRELFELDMRFGQLGPQGLFARLETAGVLSPGVDGIDPIDPAMSTPPGGSRARLRGEMIQRLSGGPSRAHCDWESIVDFERRRILDLSDPFATDAAWADLPPSAFGPFGSFGSLGWLGFGREDDLLRVRRDRILRRISTSGG